MHLKTLKKVFFCLLLFLISKFLERILSKKMSSLISIEYASDYISNSTTSESRIIDPSNRKAFFNHVH